jgi:hypothetical protein
MKFKYAHTTKRKKNIKRCSFSFGGEGALHVKSTIFPFPEKIKFTMIFYQKFLKFSRNSKIFLKKAEKMMKIFLKGGKILKIGQN